ncbi:uncharacterized protein LOC144109705 [Amblyomma americanum]
MAAAPEPSATPTPLRQGVQDGGTPIKKVESEKHEQESPAPASLVAKPSSTQRNELSPKKNDASPKNTTKPAKARKTIDTRPTRPRDQSRRASEERKPLSRETTPSRRKHGASGSSPASAAKTPDSKSSPRAHEPGLRMRKSGDGQDVEAGRVKQTELASVKRSKAKASSSGATSPGHALQTPSRRPPALDSSTDYTLGGSPRESRQEEQQQKAQAVFVPAGADQQQQAPGETDEDRLVASQQPLLPSAIYAIQEAKDGARNKESKAPATVACNVDGSARANEDDSPAAGAGRKADSEGGRESRNGVGVKQGMEEGGRAAYQVPSASSKPETRHGSNKKPITATAPKLTPKTPAYQYAALQELAATMKAQSPMSPRATWQPPVAKHTCSRAWTVVACVGVFAVMTVLLGLFLRGSRSTVRLLCASTTCAQLSAAFDAALNYSADPCVDMDRFVCSKWLNQGVEGGRGPLSASDQSIQEYELEMVGLFLKDKTTFTASSILTQLFTECTGGYEKSPSMESFRRFFSVLSVPWPFDPTDKKKGLHPLEAVLTLSLSGGVDTWFRAYLQKGRQRPSTSNFSATTALYIEEEQPEIHKPHRGPAVCRRRAVAHRMAGAPLPWKLYEVLNNL